MLGARPRIGSHGSRCKSNVKSLEFARATEAIEALRWWLRVCVCVCVCVCTHSKKCVPEDERIL